MSKSRQHCVRKSRAHVMLPKVNRIIHRWRKVVYRALWREEKEREREWVMVQRMTIKEIWMDSREQAQRRGSKCKKEWGSYFACTCWYIWKRRNEKYLLRHGNPFKYYSREYYQ